MVGNKEDMKRPIFKSHLVRTYCSQSILVVVIYRLSKPILFLSDFSFRINEIPSSISYYYYYFVIIKIHPIST